MSASAIASVMVNSMEGEKQQASHVEQIQKEKWYTPLTRVTPLSKYLAMMLFVALPFVGFWLGMEYGNHIELSDVQAPLQPQAISSDSQGDPIGTNVLSAVQGAYINHEMGTINIVDDQVTVYGLEVTARDGTSADPSTFEHLGDGYYRDKYRAYYEGVGAGISELPHADPLSLRAIGGGYAQDKYAVYYMDRRREDVDMNTFVPIGHSFAADERHVYYGMEAIPGASTDDFMLLNHWYGKSSLHVYFFFEGVNVVEGVDPVTFDVLQSGNVASSDEVWGIGKDAHSIVRWGNVEEGVSPHECTITTLELCMNDNLISMHQEGCEVRPDPEGDDLPLESTIYKDIRNGAVCYWTIVPDQPMYTFNLVTDYDHNMVKAIEVFSSPDEEIPVQTLSFMEGGFSVYDSWSLLFTEDINFDGYQDLAIQWDEGSGGASYFIWLYAPATNRFEDSGGLSNFSLDAEEETINTWWRAGACNKGEEKHRYINGVLTTIWEQNTRCTDGYKMECIAHELIDGEMATTTCVYDLSDG